MAGAKKNSGAIGILFQVAGGGDINGETGTIINQQLKMLVSAINNSKTPEIKFRIDYAALQKDVANIKKVLQGAAGGSGGSSGSRKSAVSQLFKEATSSAREYYKYLDDAQRRSSKTTELTLSEGVLQTTNPERYGRYVEEFTRVAAKYRDAVSDLQSHGGADEIFKFSTFENQLSARSEMFGIDAITRAQTAYSNLSEKARTFIEDNKDIAAMSIPEVRSAFSKLGELANRTGDDAYKSYEELNSQLRKTRDLVKGSEKDFVSWGQKFKNTFSTRIRSALAGLGVAAAIQGFRLLVNSVVEVDSALTDLQIVTKATDDQLKAFTNSVEEASKRSGASIVDLTRSATTFARLGFSLADASKYAELTEAYSRVSGVTVDEATTNLTGVIKAFGVTSDEFESVLDRLIYVGNNYAISSGEIGEGMNNAASALAAGGNDINEAMVILTAANTTVQNIAKASTAVRTISARLSKSKAELETMGEDTDGLAESTAAYQKELLALSGVDIKDTNGRLKSTYEILDELAAAWTRVEEAGNKEAVATLVASTRNQNIFYSILQNWQDTKSIIKEVEDGAASSELANATETRLSSVRGMLDVLKSSFVSFSKDFLSSDAVKLVLSLANRLMNILTFVGKIVSAVGGLKTILVQVAAISIIKNYKDIIAWFQLLPDLFKSITSKLGGFVAGLSATQAALIAVTLAISFVAAAIGKVKQVREEQMRASIQASQAAVDEAKAIADNVKSLDDLIARYKGVEAARIGNRTQGQLDEVKSIQEEINALIGDQAKQIDVVNGKYDEQILKLDSIREKDITAAIESAQRSQIDAVSAFKSSRFFDTVFGSDVQKIPYGETFKMLRSAGAFLDFAGGNQASSSGVGFRTSFSTIEDFVKQYEIISKVVSDMKDLEAHGKGVFTGTSGFNALTGFLSDSREIYNQYKDTADAIEKYEAELEKIIAGKDNSAALALKSTLDILEALEGPYDALTAAIKAFNEQGYISSENFEPLLDTYPQLAQYLYETEYGYTITADALERYLELQRDEIIATYLSSKATSDKETALKNLQRFLLVENTLRRKAVASEKADTSALNAQKDALKDQLDAYKDLVDYRKKLLKTYQDELDYQRELEKKQKNVATLQQKLAVAQLDDSEAGRRRARELSADLASAQEDLDDFTLDHAIEVLTNDLDMQYEEYKNMIDGEIDRVENAISALKDSNASTVSAATISLEQALADYEARQDAKRKTAASAKETMDAHYAEKAAKYADPLWDISETPVVRSPFIRSDNETKSPFIRSDDEGNKWFYDFGTKKWVKIESHHSGGLIGNINALKQNEEFAVLMKGEHVSTPAQVKRFMDYTLPQMSSIAASAGGNEFNAPLVSIECGTVTQDALPGLKTIVDEAVTEVKRQLDSGMSRVGYKPTVKKFIN